MLGNRFCTCRRMSRPKSGITAVKKMYFPDEAMWVDKNLWQAYCTALYPGLLRPQGAITTMKQHEIPVFVISNDNPTFVHHMVRYLLCYNSTVVVYDQGSTFRPHYWLLSKLSKYVEVQTAANVGPHSFFTKSHVLQLPPYFAVTDADVKLNPDAPPNFLGLLAHLTILFPGRKAGVALSLENRANFMQGEYHLGKDIVGWESKYWAANCSVTVSGLADPVYLADIDTTFAVYRRDTLLQDEPCNEKMCFNIKAVRVGGSLMGEHVPWLQYFPSMLPRHEFDYYYLSKSRIGSTMQNMLRKEQQSVIS